MSSRPTTSSSVTISMTTFTPDPQSSSVGHRLTPGPSLLVRSYSRVTAYVGEMDSYLDINPLNVVGTWATDAEIFATALMLNSNIYIYSDFYKSWQLFGFYSWRSTQKGSWCMQALSDAFNIYGYQLDLLTILTFVNRQVAIDYESNVPGTVQMHQQKHIPCITSMLTRLVKFEKKN
ncbi:hypothetical protein ACI65C_008482 [Semiaphis heraclei]